MNFSRQQVKIEAQKGRWKGCLRAQGVQSREKKYEAGDLQALEFLVISGTTQLTFPGVPHSSVL